MRIAMFSWESLYTVQVGGLAVSATVLAEELAASGHDVSYFTRAARGQPAYMRINNVDYHTFAQDPFPSSYGLSLDMSARMVELLHRAEAHGGRYDLVHGHDWLVVDALQRLKNEGRSVVVTYHSTEYGRNGARHGDWQGFREISDRERYAGEISDRITTVSVSMREELEWLYGIPGAKVDVIPNAIHREAYQFDIDQGSVKKKYGIHPLVPVVLFAGRHEYQKGPDILIEAVPEIFRGYPEAQFVFVGQGGMRRELERRVRELGVDGSVSFLGFLSHLEYLEILNSCNLVCIPSRNEPFGLVLLEAWSAGKPVVATGVGGLGENIRDARDGIIVGPDPSSVARGIGRLLSDPGLMRSIAEAGRRRAGEFGWRRVVESFEGTYRRALGNA